MPGVSRWATRGHLASLALGGAVLVLLQRGQWFFTDEWDPILLRGAVGPASRSILEPHNEHWSTLAFALYRVHYAGFGVRTYLPLALLFVATLVLTAHLLWRVCIRCGADPWIATGLVLVAMVFGPAHEELVFAWNVTFVAALACGFGMLLGSSWRSSPFDRRDALTLWGLGVVAIACSGVGLTMVAVVGLTAVVRRGWRTALAGASVPVVVYGVWTLGWSVRGEPLLSGAGVRGVPRFVAEGLTSALGNVVGVTALGILVLVALGVYAVLVGRRWRGDRIVALTCFVGAIGFEVSVALRRHSEFLPGPETGRYLLVAFALTVPILALATTDAIRSARRRLGDVGAGWIVGGVAALLGVLAVVQVTWLVDDAAATRETKQAQRRQVVAAAQILASGRPVVGPTVLGSSVFERSLTVGRLRRMARSGALPDVGPDPAAVVAAKADLLVDVRRGRPPATPARVVGLHDVTLTARSDRCWRAVPTGPDPRVTFAPVDSVSGAALGTPSDWFHVGVAAGGVRSALRPVLVPEPPVALVVAPGGDEEVDLGVLDGPLRLCGVELDPAVGQAVTSAGSSSP